jgi:hypothetical protein
MGVCTGAPIQQAVPLLPVYLRQGRKYFAGQ